MGRDAKLDWVILMLQSSNQIFFRVTSNAIYTSIEKSSIADISDLHSSKRLEFLELS